MSRLLFKSFGNLTIECDGGRLDNIGGLKNFQIVGLTSGYVEIRINADVWKTNGDACIEVPIKACIRLTPDDFGLIYKFFETINKEK